MRKVVLNLAVSSMDTLPALTGEYDWCFTDDDYGMTDFLKSVDATLMGGKSYRLVISDGGLAYWNLPIMFLPAPKRNLRTKMWYWFQKTYLSSFED